MAEDQAPLYRWFFVTIYYSIGFLLKSRWGVDLNSLYQSGTIEGAMVRSAFLDHLKSRVSR